MSDAYIQITPDSDGKRIDNSLLTIDGQQVYRQRVEAYAGADLPVTGTFWQATQPVSGPLTDAQLRASRVDVTTNGAFGHLLADAWGVPKVSLPYSLFHGLFTFDVPATQWFIYEGGTQVYTSTNVVSTGSAGTITATAAKPSVVLQSRDCPRYQPNRGHLYSTALWCPSKTADGVREWGLATIENGVFFRLRADGLLYAVLRSGGVEMKEELIDTSGVAGFDVEAGNVYDAQYQWRGVGNYRFYINLVHVHTFANLGTLTALSMQNPALPAYFKAVRTTADVSMSIGCVDITSENGSDNSLQPRVAYANISRNGTDIPVVSIHNPLLIDGQTNTRTIYPVRLGFGCDKKAVFKILRHRDASLLTGETFVALGAGSYMQTDSPDTVATAVAATAATVASMELIDVVNVQANGVAEWRRPDTRMDFTLVRGDYLTVTATTTVGLCDVVICWAEAL
jgi:hypothetical protein